MTATEFLLLHLRREARERALARCVELKFTPHETSEALAKATPANAAVTVTHLQRSIDVCEYVIANAWNYPAEQVAEMKRSAAWKRELMSKMRDEGVRDLAGVDVAQW